MGAWLTFVVLLLLLGLLPVSALSFWVAWGPQDLAWHQWDNPDPVHKPHASAGSSKDVLVVVAGAQARK